jgi:RNA polymerase sigma-70 factor (ECF subfamily)
VAHRNLLFTVAYEMLGSAADAEDVPQETWLPEPMLTAPDVAEDVELAESVSMALMLVLETLAPTERAVFVLREVFDIAYDDIAEAVGKTPTAVRQIAHRARKHVDARRPREVVSAGEARAALESCGRAHRATNTHGRRGGGPWSRFSAPSSLKTSRACSTCSRRRSFW